MDPARGFDHDDIDVARDILVVDDDPNNLVAIEVALGDLGARLVKASSGTEALRHLLKQDFALILLDVQMPSMDGFETARLIRARDRSRHVPIIFITAHSHDDDAVLKGYDLGAVDFLFKPIVPEVLRTKASVFVELQRRSSEIARQAELLREHERREHDRSLAEARQRWEAESLRRINGKLKEADRKKDEFLALLAHELRNPLAPIVAALEVIRLADADPALLMRSRAIIERQVVHLTRLVDDLLEVSRITNGKLELCRERIEIGAVVAQAIATSEVALQEKRHLAPSTMTSSRAILASRPRPSRPRSGSEGGA